MKDNQECFMTYSFMCPWPCDQEFMVKARDKFDAVEKIVMAGAISCRNRIKHCNCEKAHLAMPPMPADQLKNIVGLCVQEVCGA